MANKKVIVLIILSLLAVVSLFYGMLSPPKTKRREISAKGENLSSEARVPSKGSLIKSERRAKKTEFTSWGKNPFIPEKEPVIIAPDEGITLKGILWNKNKPKAMINDYTVSEGDKIEGNKVVRIKEDSVILNNGSADFEVKLKR